MGRLTGARYTEHRPPAALAEHVESLWTHRISAGCRQPILPDGRMDLVAVGGDLIVAGPATVTSVVELPAGAMTVGVRFRPGSASALIGVPAPELRDRAIPLATAWGATGRELTEQVAERDSPEHALGLLTTALAERLDRAPTVDPVGRAAVDLIERVPGLPLGTIAERIGLGERQLRRRVTDAVGYSPRTLARILRFQRFLAAARAAGPGRQLARIAADAGYADQAHLTRECRALTGRPPTALLAWEEHRLAG